MQRLVSLGILSQNTTSHTSPVMLITRKIGADKRPVVDFRLVEYKGKKTKHCYTLIERHLPNFGRFSIRYSNLCGSERCIS